MSKKPDHLREPSHREPTEREIIAAADRRQLAGLVKFNEWRNAEPSRINNRYAPRFTP